jgi:glyoxylase I family protein
LNVVVMTADQDLSLHHTGLTVSDLDRALTFWCDALGGRVLFRQQRDGGYFATVVGEAGARVQMAHVELAPGGHRIELFQFEPAGDSYRLRTADVGFAHLCVSTPDLDPVVARLEAAGGHRVSDPVQIDDGINAGGRAVYVRDPDGHVVEIFQPGSP